MTKRPNIKICGITNYDDARYSILKGAAFIGFIFYDRSPRFIEPGKAGILVSKLREEFKRGVKFVGVFVNPGAEYLKEVISETGINMVQLHGDETADFVNSFYDAEENTQISLIKAFRIKDKNDILKSAEFSTDYILFDTYSEDIYGGTGRAFNWDLLADFNSRDKLFLSGGISKENIIEAVENINPFAVDVCSSLESEPGLKDKVKVDEFFKIINSII